MNEKISFSLNTRFIHNIEDISSSVVLSRTDVLKKTLNILDIRSCLVQF